MNKYIQSGTQRPGDPILTDPFKSLASPNLYYSFPTSPLIQLQPRKVNYNHAVLGNTTHIYTTPSTTDVKNLALYFGDWGCDFEIQEGPVYTITVNVPWDTITTEDFSVSEYASEQWELVPNNGSKDLLFAGLYANSFAAPSTANNTVILPPTFQLGVQRCIDNNAAYIALPVGSTIPSASFQPYAQCTLDYMRRGVQGVPSYTQTLRRSAVIDNRNTNNAFNKTIDLQLRSFSKNNGTINFLMSSRNMLGSFDIPSNTVGQFMLPSYCRQVSVPAYNGTTSANTTYMVYGGWLIKPPTYNFITRNKVQLMQEFVWDEWLDHLYYIWSPKSDFGYPVTTATVNPPAFSAS